jgi:hypothetical protein
MQLAGKFAVSQDGPVLRRTILDGPGELSAPSPAGAVLFDEVALYSLILATKVALSVALTILVLAGMTHLSVLLLNDALPDPTFGYNGAKRPDAVVIDGAVTPINPR